MSSASQSENSLAYCGFYSKDRKQSWGSTSGIYPYWNQKKFKIFMVKTNQKKKQKTSPDVCASVPIQLLVRNMLTMLVPQGKHRLD